MNNQQTIDLIKQKLAKFHPEIINVIDESDKHAGHPGAQHGGGHFRLEIKSPAFDHQPLINSHRQIYQALAGLMQTSIHALVIKIL